MSNYTVEDIYNNVYGMMGLDEMLYLAKMANSSDDVVVEIGSLCGRSTLSLAHPKMNRVYSVDPCVGSPAWKHKRDYYPELVRNLLKYDALEFITHFRMKSEELAPIFNMPIGLLFVDGDHRYEWVKKDILLWQDKVINGGHILFHDYYEEACIDIRNAVKDNLSPEFKSIEKFASIQGYIKNG